MPSDKKTPRKRTHYLNLYASPDSNVTQWLDNQNDKTRSVELLINVCINKFGMGDIFESMLEQTLFNNSAGVNVQGTNIDHSNHSNTVSGIDNNANKQVVELANSGAKKSAILNDSMESNNDVTSHNFRDFI